MHSQALAEITTERAPRWVPHVVRSKAILVVEDEPMIGIQLESLLYDMGASAIGPVASIPAARSAIFNVHIDGAIIDLVLFNKLSFDVADLLDAACIPFVFYTGIDTRLIPERHSKSLCLMKPLSTPIVVGRLLSMLDH